MNDIRFGRCIDIQHPRVTLEQKDDGRVIATANLKLQAKVAKSSDDEIVNAIIDWAKDEGITHLYLIDEDFVRDAIMHEIQLRKFNDIGFPNVHGLDAIRYLKGEK